MPKIKDFETENNGTDGPKQIVNTDQTASKGEPIKLYTDCNSIKTPL